MKRTALVFYAVMAPVLAACTAAPTQPSKPAFDAPAAVAAIRAAGRADATELDVQPLRDPQVEDLRQQAAQLEAKRMYRGSANLLDQAIAIRPDDPALLQERAESALLLRDPAGAAQFAQRAIELGSTVGPLCRRHWEMLRQLAQARTVDVVIRRGESEAQARQRIADAVADHAKARSQRDACTVAAHQRY
ncbi:MAG TPA: hypothetical protein VGD21_07400 [Lysobacter sp.]